MRQTYTNYFNFSRDYFKGKFPGQRYGQAFCNAFGITNDAIFYCEDKTLCMAWIREHLEIHFQNV